MPMGAGHLCTILSAGRLLTVVVRLGISKESGEWIAIAKDRRKWVHQSWLNRILYPLMFDG